MSIRFVLGASALVSLAFLTTSFVTSGQEAGEQGGGADRAGMAAMMEMMRLAAPGPEHEQMMKRVGEWTADTTVYMAPGAAPMTSEGRAVARAVLGGRFIQADAEVTLMGMELQSIGFLGFDRRRDVYTTIGLDSSGTYWVTAEGVKGEDGILRMRGVDDSPEGRQTYTFEIEDISDDEYVLRVFFDEQAGVTYDPPFKMVDIHYNRVVEASAGE